MTFAELVGAASALMLRQFDPETAHTLAVLAMRLALAPAMPTPRDPRLEVPLFDLRFPHPVGLAAGFDKDAEIADALLTQGFGHIEVGTVTPRPQPGNPKPRIFRLPEAGAVINRCGFNGKGHAHALKQLEKRAGRPGIVAVNLGANKDSADRAEDYAAGVKAFARHAAFLTINISSPNTPGLRTLQGRAALDDLVGRALAAREETVESAGRRVPLLVKIAPDLTETDLDDIAAVVTARGVDGLVVSNTTLSRAGVAGGQASEAGGLSGRPLFRRSTIVLAKMRARVGAGLPIIGVGGISTGEDAWHKLEAGADLLQLYTGFIYGGGNMVVAILRELIARLEAEKLASITAVSGRRTADWAALPIPD